MKVFAIEVLTILALSAISATNGLRCYNCIYAEGLDGSQDDCRASPPENYLLTCSGTRALSAGNDQVSKVSNALLKFIEKPGTSPRKPGDALCINLTAEYEGKNLIMRSCSVALEDGDLDGKCDDLGDSCDLGICLRNVKQCYCTSDGCNKNNPGDGENAGVSLMSMPIIVISGLGLLTTYFKF